jgi:hypothetical protein
MAGAKTHCALELVSQAATLQQAAGAMLTDRRGAVRNFTHGSGFSHPVSETCWNGVLPDLRVRGALPRVLGCGLLGCGNATLCMVATLCRKQCPQSATASDNEQQHGHGAVVNVRPALPSP